MEDPPLLPNVPRWAKVLGGITLGIITVVALYLLILGLIVVTRWVF